jgi:hypothetical protein
MLPFHAWHVHVESCAWPPDNCLNVLLFVTNGTNGILLVSVMLAHYKYGELCSKEEING